MIIDFYGIPGCGKSTVSHILAELYRRNGNSVSEPTYELDHDNSAISRKVKKLLIAATWPLLHPKKAYCIFAILLRNKLHFYEVLSEMMSIIVKAYYVEKAKQYSNMIFDEGLTQSVISFPNIDVKQVGEELQLLENTIYDVDTVVYRVYIKVNIETAFSRMKHRLTNDSRVEKEKSLKKRIEMMNNYQERCDSVNLDNCFVIIGNDGSAEIIAYDVMTKLKVGENQ